MMSNSPSSYGVSPAAPPALEWSPMHISGKNLSFAFSAVSEPFGFFLTVEYVKEETPLTPTIS